MSFAKALATIFGALFILAFLVRPACGCTTKVPAYYTHMKSDLRNLVTAQEGFFMENRRYARSMAEFGDSLYRTSTYVTIEITPAGDSAWQATARHEQLPEVSCSIAVSFDSAAPNASSGEPVCEPPYKRRRWAWAWQ